MTRNKRLAAAIAADGRRQYLLAAQVGMAPSTLANVIAGRQEISAVMQERIAEVLGVHTEGLFGSDDLVVAVA